MAEQRQTTYGQVLQHQPQNYPTDAFRGMLPDHSPSKSQIIAVVTLFPIGGTLLLLSGLTLAGTLIGLAVATPLFVIFSPVLVPAAIVIALAVAGFLTSGAFGIIALSSLSWMANFLRKVGDTTAPEQMQQFKRRIQDTAGQIGQKTKETGQAIP
ncbi:hypothetical protein LWI29_026540 [Acer saccharum]|uniref:Oleosin n=2 Tax=Acer TaxID=4022 RepID=A0A5C7GZL1_9ROSI|nr:hypothetical protein LWI29_026540 [Acer saccharum]KAK1564558.1 hypothetical protein Q3G72_005788 [Acer saccharum]TXG50220.1 hypothetical protein EZV62_022744 [Acer yangbiense]